MSRGAAETSAPKSVGIWVRVSTEDQARGDSPEHHERRAKAYAESRDWDVREVYRLAAVSGKSVREHPEAKRMLADIERGHISGLIFSKLARLARNTRELLDFADYFRAHSADLISLQESIDTSTPAGRLFYTMIAAMAQWEREEIADRVAASVKVRAQMGKPLGGAAIYGYRWDGHKLVVNDKEAPVRRLMYELFLEHRRKKRVARLLNEAGHRTRAGKLWSDTTVDRLLRDPTAKGTRRANYTRSTDNKKAWEPKPESEWILSPVEAIVSADLWEQVNGILGAQREGNRRPPGRQSFHLFAGLTVCSCGAKMYVPSDTPKYVCRKCRNKIPETDLEAIFMDRAKSFLDGESVAEILEGTDAALVQKQELLGTLDAEQKKVRSQIDELFRLREANEIPVAGFGRRYEPLEQRLSQFDDEIPRLQGEIDFLRIQLLSRDEALTDAERLTKRLDLLEPAEKRQIVEDLCDRITVGKGEVEIHLRYLPFRASEEVATRQHDLARAAGSARGCGPAAARRASRRGTAAASPGRCSTASTCGSR